MNYINNVRYVLEDITMENEILIKEMESPLQFLQSKCTSLQRDFRFLKFLVST